MEKQTVKIDVFDTDVVIIQDDDKDVLNSEIQKIQLKEDKIIDYVFDEYKIGVTFQVDSTIYILLNTKELHLIMHEIYHCITLLYERISLPMEYLNDEFGAYLMTYLVKNIKFENLT